MKQLLTYTIACLWCWATLIPLQAQGLKSFLSGGVTSGTDYTVNTAVFDGTNDYWRSTSGDTGWADTTGLSVSFWVKPAGDGTVRMIASYSPTSGVEHFAAYLNGSNQLRLRASNSTSVVGSAVDLTSSVTLTAAGGWKHVFWAVQTGNPTNTQLWVDGVEDTSLTETTNTGTMDFTITGDRTSVGANTSGTPGQLMNGALAELCVYVSYLAPSTNLSKFYDAGNPVNLGPNATTPTGSQPVIYFSGNGSGNNWTPQGTAGDSWALTGTLGTDTSP